MQDNSTREKILIAALDLFSQKGCAATGIDEIAESIGMKGPNIYKYFKGKEAIFEELCYFPDQEYNTNMLIDSPFPRFVSNGEELKLFSLRQLKFTLGDDFAVKQRKMLAIEQFRNKELAERATRFQYDNMVEQFKSIFARMMENGVLEKSNPEMLALEYMAPTSLLIQICDRHPERKEEIMKKIEEHIDYFISKNFNVGKKSKLLKKK